MNIISVIQKIPMHALPILSLLLLTGCWSSVELNDRTFTRTIALDKPKTGIELTLVFPLPNRLIPGSAGGSGGEQPGKPYTYITKSEETIGQAFRKIQSDLSRKITFGQTSSIIIGRELAEAGIMPILDFIAREKRMHINILIFIAPGKAKEFVLAPTILERFPSEILTAYGKQGIIIDTTAKDLLMANYNGGDQLVSMLTFKKGKIESEKEKIQTWMGTDGAAIFREGKMVGTLNTEEMRGGMWITEDLQDAEISVPSPSDGKNISFIIHNPKTKIKPQFKGEQVEFQIKSQAEAEIFSSDSTIDLTDVKQLEQLEQSLNLKVKNRITQAITKVKEANSDAFHLGNYIDWNYPKRWKTMQPHWRELYSDSVTVAIETHIKIKWLGTVKKPIQVITDAKAGGGK